MVEKLIIKTARKSYIVLYSLCVLSTILFFVLGFDTIHPYATMIFLLIILTVASHPEWQVFYYTFVVDKNRVIVISGFLNKKRLTIPVSSIAHVTMDKSLLGRIFNYGDVHVNAFGEKSMVLKGVNNPDKIIHTLEKMMEATRQQKETK